MSDESDLEMSVQPEVVDNPRKKKRCPEKWKKNIDKVRKPHLSCKRKVIIFPANIKVNLAFVKLICFHIHLLVVFMINFGI